MYILKYVARKLLSEGYKKSHRKSDGDEMH